MEAAASLDDAPSFHGWYLVTLGNNHAKGLIPRFPCGRPDRDGLREGMQTRMERDARERVRLNTAGCLEWCEVGLHLAVHRPSVLHKEGAAAGVAANLERHLRDGERRSERSFLAIQQDPIEALFAHYRFDMRITPCKPILLRP